MQKREKLAGYCGHGNVRNNCESCNKERIDFLGQLEFPAREEVESMDFKSLHELWSKNHEMFMRVVNSLDLSKFPHLAVHGSREGGLDFLQRKNIPAYVSFNNKKPSDEVEAAAILYHLASVGVQYTRVERDFKPGSLVICSLGQEKESSRNRLQEKKDNRTSVRFLNPQPLYPKPFNPGEELNEKNWIMSPCDTVPESRIFSYIEIMEEHGDIQVNKIDAEKLFSSPELNLVVNQNELPGYEHLKSENKIIDGYRAQVALRLESLKVAIKIIEKYLL